MLTNKLMEFIQGLVSKNTSLVGKEWNILCLEINQIEEKKLIS